MFRHENVTGKVSPEQMQEWMQQQMEWIGNIEAEGKYISGTGLMFEDAKVVHANKSVVDGAFGSGTETIGGFIRVKAESLDEAIEFAKGAPILQGEGNTVEVREVIVQ